MTGTEQNAPTTIVDSGRIRVLGCERNDPGNRSKIIGTGKLIYWCIEVKDGRHVGCSFAVGSDELETWKGN